MLCLPALGWNLEGGDVEKDLPRCAACKTKVAKRNRNNNNGGEGGRQANSKKKKGNSHRNSF